MARMMADCRRWPSETNCSLVIIGEEDEVVQAAAEHAASVHGHKNVNGVVLMDNGAQTGVYPGKVLRRQAI